VPAAGVWTGDRLSSMLDNAAMAFLICTAEDEHADSTRHARENVIHEAGLFQGRLGFERAIILLEDSCSEFSNVHGLGQIRFPEGNISAKFEEIRNVLEREGIIRPTSLPQQRTRRMTLLLSGTRWIAGQRTNDACPLAAGRCALSAARPAAQDSRRFIRDECAVIPDKAEHAGTVYCLFFLPGSPPCTPGVAAAAGPCWSWPVTSQVMR